MRRLLPGLVLVAFAAAMLAPLLFGGEIFHFRDFGRFYRPVRSLWLERLKAGEFPVWMPEINCGTAVHGELVHGLLYPGNVLLLAGECAGWGLFFAAHLVLAGLGARALARRLGASADGSLLAAVAFAGSGYLVAQMNHVPYMVAAAWSPLLVNLGLASGAGGGRSVPLLAAAYAAAALAGEPLTLILSTILLVTLVLAGLAGGGRLRTLGAIAAAGGIAVLLASPAILPALQTLPESVRGVGYGRDIGDFGSLHPVRLAALLVPEACGRFQVSPILDYTLFGRSFTIPSPILLGIHLGAVPVLLLFAAPWRRSRAAKWLAGVALSALVLSLGTYVGVGDLFAGPGAGIFRYPDKMWFLTALAVALLAGLAADRTRGSTAVAGAALATAAALLGVALGNVAAGLAGAVPFALAAAATRAPARLRVRLLTGVLAAELLFLGLRLNATARPEELSPKQGIGAPLAARHPKRLFVEFLFPYAMADRRTADLSAPLARALDSLTGIAEGFSYSIGYDPAEPSWRNLAYLHSVNQAPLETRREVFHRLLRLIGTTHSVSNVDLRGDPELLAVAQAPGGIRAYEYARPLPRARLYGQAAAVPDVGAAQRLLSDLRFDAERALVLEGPPSPAHGGGGEARIVEDAPRRVVVEVRAGAPMWLFLADTFAPGWEATVNGAPAEIRRAFIAFRAVRVPQGESRVEFLYEPKWLRTAPFPFILGLLFLLAAAIGTRRRGARPAPAREE